MPEQSESDNDEDGELVEDLFAQYNFGTGLTD